jgi:antitoxin HicB
MVEINIKERATHYASLPYKIIIDRYDDQGVYYMARVLEIPELEMPGDTPEEALAELENVKLEWMEKYLELGNTMPLPLATRRHSGNLHLRMEPSLHSSLAERAGVEGVSLNQYINTTLSRAIGVAERQKPLTRQKRT